MSRTNSNLFIFFLIGVLFLNSSVLLFVNAKLRQDLKVFEQNYIERSKLVADNIESLEFRCFALSLNTIPEVFPHQVSSYEPARILPPQRVFTNGESLRTPSCTH